MLIQMTLQNKNKNRKQHYPMLRQGKENPDSVWDNCICFTSNRTTRYDVFSVGRNKRAARSFENYVINEMALKGYDNDYLANVKSWDQWPGKNPERYPYLKPGEIAPVKEAFDNLFSTLKTKETERGIALY